MSIVSPSWHTADTPVDAQLRDLERQGGGMARLAHLCAGLLLIAFSLGSLISISATAFFRFLAQWNGGAFDIPDAISLVVNVLLVLAADVALLYAASVLRVLVTAGAPLAEQRVHRWAMIGACVLESSTYLYLVWTFDRPTTLFLWAIGIGRALAAPLCAAYLSMARPLPVGPRDVAYQAALAAGKGVVRDVTVLAGDPTAPLSRKVRIYSSAALMSAPDAERFRNIIEAVSEDVPAAAGSLPEPPPNGPQTPPDDEDREDWRDTSREWPSLQIMPGRTRMSRNERRKLSRMSEKQDLAFGLLDGDPTMSKTQLKDLLRVRQETANKFWAQWHYAQRQAAQQ